MARTYKLSSALQAVFNVLENKGRHSEEYGDLLRKIKETQSLQNQAVINAAIAQWEEENPELWQEFDDGDYRLKIGDLELAALAVEGKKITVGTLFDEDNNPVCNFDTTALDPTDKEASIERLQRSIGRAVTRRVGKIHDTLFKVYTDA